MCERYPQNYIPTHYELFLHIIKDKYPIDASVTITFQKIYDAEDVFLHISPNITIKKIDQNGSPLQYTIKNYKLIIFRSTDPAQDISSFPITIDYSLMPNFEESYQKKPHGFYVYKDSYLTKFELSYARQLLPCFDEPCIRSSYTVKIRIPSNLTGISNMPVQTQTMYDNDKLITFQPTPTMCSYLLCICIGPFSFIEGVTKSGTPVKFYAETGKENSLNEYLKVAIFSLEWLESKLNVKYELPHLQLITYPGCKIGMENYGLITLCDYTDGTEFFRHSKVVMHEIAHQWFGDLVSIKWWDSVWLNEGFAQFYQFLMLNDCPTNPEYLGKGVKHFVDLDGFRCLRFFDKEKICPNATELDFSQRTLKSVIYIKGGFVLKMFMDIVGEDLFYKVCENWCNLYKYKCAEANDFISVANSTVNRDYSEFFNVWLRLVGFPVLFVNHLTSDDGKYCGIVISEMNYDKSVFQMKIPIVCEKNGKIERMEVFIRDDNTKIEVEFDWIIVNDELSSLSVVIYTKELLQLLLNAKSQGKLSKSNCLLISESPKIASKFGISDEIVNLTRQFEE